MREGIKQEICGHLSPLRINRFTITGEVLTLIDWNAIAAFHRPEFSKHYNFKGQLEYLQCDYYISSLNTINSANLPNVNELRDTNLQKQSKYHDFKRKYNPATGHAVEVMLHTKWESYNWGIPKASEYLYNLGQYGYLNLFDPYLIRDSEVLYSDDRLKIGVSFHGTLGDFDIIEINGGYSGVISFLELPTTQELYVDSGSKDVGVTATRIVLNRNNRKMLFVSNAGDSRLFFAFGNSSSVVSTNSPFLEPGESLTVEFDRAFWSGGNQNGWVASAIAYYLPLSLYGIRESGSGKACYQDFF